MATSFDIRTTAGSGGIDTRWRASKHGEANARPGMLDISSFSDSDLVNGRVPSGTPLTYDGDTGLYKKWTLNEIPGNSDPLDGFVNDDEGVLAVVDGVKLDTEPCSVLVHGIIDIQYVPGVTDNDYFRAALDAVNSGSFVLVK